eukprot:Em0007g102a
MSCFPFDLSEMAATQWQYLKQRFSQVAAYSPDLGQPSILALKDIPRRLPMRYRTAHRSIHFGVMQSLILVCRPIIDYALVRNRHWIVGTVLLRDGRIPNGIPGLTLPEISAESIEDYERSWTRYELIAAANKWENGKVLAVLPALLRGKLLDFYAALEDSEKIDLITLKQALAERAGLTKSPFIAAKLFGERRRRKGFLTRNGYDQTGSPGVSVTRPEAIHNADNSGVTIVKKKATSDVTAPFGGREKTEQSSGAQRSARAAIANSAPLTVGANGIPLDVLVVEVRKLARMDQDEFSVVKDYLRMNQYPKGISKGDKANLRRKCKNFKFDCESALFQKSEERRRGVIGDYDTGHEETTIYKGTQMGAFTSGQCVMSVGDEGDLKTQNDRMPEVDLSSSSITPQEKKLEKLLYDFRGLFVSEGGPLGRTSVVKHAIKTTGPPIREPLRRIPHSLRNEVATEVKRMMEGGVIRQSNSPWSSPVVMVEVEEGDKKKTAFSTREGHFEFNVMPFGLTNAPATFERLMECVLAGLTFEYCLVYLDDIVVFSADLDQHLRRLTVIFQRLSAAGLKLKANKCHFAKSEIKYLGHIVPKRGIKADPEKLTAMSTGYKWSSACQEAFESLKQLLISPPILAYPRFEHPFTVATDASGTALGAVLSQTIDGEERVIAYWSRQLNKAERNYSTIEREALGAVAAIKEFFPYLYGRRFTLLTDHNPLTSLRGLKDTGGRLTRWLLYLQQFDMTIRYRSGKFNTIADVMSRRQISSDATLHAGEDDSMFVHGVTVFGEADTLKREQEADEVTGSIRHSIKDGKRLASTRFPNSKLQVVVPKDLRAVIIDQLHAKSGHLGGYKTFGKGNQYILVVTDLFSKWVEAFPLAKTDSTTLAAVLTDEIVCVPEAIHSDQGPNFVSGVIQSLCDRLGIKRTQTTAYHPQGNGQVERFNRTLEDMLAKVISDNHRDWDDHLQKCLFAYRTAIHESTGYTPFLATFGRTPNLPVDVILGSRRAETQPLAEYVRKTQTTLKTAFTEVRERLKAAHAKQKQLADKGACVLKFHVGDRVWLFVPTVKRGQTKKFVSLWRGPYTILDKHPYGTGTTLHKPREGTAGYVTLDKDASNGEGDEMERGPLDHVEEQEAPIFAEEDNARPDDDVVNTTTT